jgi:hypothetical protein
MTIGDLRRKYIISTNLIQVILTAGALIGIISVFLTWIVIPDDGTYYFYQSEDYNLNGFDVLGSGFGGFEKYLPVMILLLFCTALIVAIFPVLSKLVGNYYIEHTVSVSGNVLVLMGLSIIVLSVIFCCWNIDIAPPGIGWNPMLSVYHNMGIGPKIAIISGVMLMVPGIYMAISRIMENRSILYRSRKRYN